MQNPTSVHCSNTAKIRCASTFGLACLTTILLLLGVGTSAFAQSKSTGSQTPGASPSGGGGAAASAEGVARMYMAIAAASDDIADQLFVKYTGADKPQTYILYEPRMVNDLTTFRTFQVPLDLLYDEVHGKPSKSSADNRQFKSGAVAHAFALANALPEVAAATANASSGGVLKNVTLGNVITTLNAIAAIPSSQTTTVAGAAGTLDADAIIASELASKFSLLIPSVRLYAPAILPLALPQIAQTDDAGPVTPDLSSTLETHLDPVTEVYTLQMDLLQLVQTEQKAILDAYTDFASTRAATLYSGTPAVVTAYTALVNDLKAAVTWVPQVQPAPAQTTNNNGGTTNPAAQGANQQGATATNAPYATIQADILQLYAVLGKKVADPPLPNPATGDDALAAALYKLRHVLLDDKNKDADPPLSKAYIPELDETIRCLQALNAIATTLGGQVQPYGTATSGSPGAASPDTTANIVTRGWQVSSLLKNKKTKLLRVHFEMAQPTDKTISTLWGLKFIKDSSAVAQLSFMVFGHDASPELSSWSLAYYGFQNADDPLRADNLQILNPFNFKPVKRKAPKPAEPEETP